jgi:hypothetical protein
MTKHLYLIIISTFVFGFLTGVIILLSSSMDRGGSDKVLEDTRGFVITARAYGGCERAGGGVCPSYRINEEGKYTYLIPKQDGEIAQFSGVLSPAQQSNVKAGMRGVNFATVEKSTFSGTCPITYDGLAYRYDIEYETGRYTLDSCVQTLQNDFFLLLEEYFVTFYELHVRS